VADADFTRFDYLLAMDRDNLEGLVRRRPPGATAQVALLLSFAPALGDIEVPDPYYDTEDGFERVIALVEAGCRGFLRHVRSARGGQS
jgi:protein-tyrosine phosphatase